MAATAWTELPYSSKPNASEGKNILENHSYRLGEPGVDGLRTRQLEAAGG